MKVCLFGGTFDPPHLGHLIIAQTIFEAENFDQIVFVPAYQPPHKNGMKISPVDQRLEMLNKEKMVLGLYASGHPLDDYSLEVKYFCTNQLKDIERPKASQAIAEARDKGDLSENAEYDAAKEAQGLLEARIAKLENDIANSRVLDKVTDTSSVHLLTEVVIKNLQNGVEMKYAIVSESEADFKNKKISVESPIGKGLMGKSIGEIARIKVPNGTIEFEVMQINSL